jgi:hypothetical protein
MGRIFYIATVFLAPIITLIEPKKPLVSGMIIAAKKQQCRKSVSVERSEIGVYLGLLCWRGGVSSRPGRAARREGDSGLSWDGEKRNTLALRR